MKRKTRNLLKLLGCTMIFAIGSLATVNHQVIGPNCSAQTVKAATTGQIRLYSEQGYTKSNILKANDGHLSNTDRKKLIHACMAGMKNNHFTDTNSSDQRIVDVMNLNQLDQVELSKYALTLINSARRQMGMKDWTYSNHVLHFARCVAQEYDKDHTSCWDSDHDYQAIERAAKTCGLNTNVGQVYEDETGLPITSKWNGTQRSMVALKGQIYFNVEQMLFGGFYGNEIDYDNATHYTEWQHAGDLLGLRTKPQFEPKTKSFGLSFSCFDGHRISVHMMSVAKDNILNYKKFDK